MSGVVAPVKLIPRRLPPWMLLRNLVGYVDVTGTTIELVTVISLKTVTPEETTVASTARL